MMKEVGKVTHYYSNIGVAIIELSGALAVGDIIKIGGLEQAVSSMESEHQAIQSAKNGDVVGIKVDGKVNEGAIVEKE